MKSNLRKSGGPMVKIKLETPPLRKEEIPTTLPQSPLHSETGTKK